MARHTLWLVFGLLVGYAAASAQTPSQGGPDAGVQPNRLIDRDEVRVSRVELAPGAVRSIHAHTDVLYHLFIPLTDHLQLTMGSSTVETKAGQAYFLAAGTSHGFSNTGQSAAAVMEVFVKDFSSGR
jgi:quercetin dioxygenase-like cupin family protein